MADTPITELDFNGIKNQLIAYLQNQTQFKDYNFEGSNMSVLLDVLAYNTFQNNFYTNIAISEMFLDSAVFENSVISHAKHLNYLPRSPRSARAVVRVTINSPNENASTIEIPRFTNFISSYQSVIYNFVTDKSYVARKVATGVYVADNVEIYEGTILSGVDREVFTVDDQNIINFVLTDDRADIRTVEVLVSEQGQDELQRYIYKSDIFGVEADDRVFYISPHFDGRYAVYFGRNIFGRQPQINQTITVSYRRCSGPAPNGASSFSTSFRQNTTVETIERASGGSAKESIDSIKFNAPKSIQIQERAVTVRDYEILLKRNFPEVRSVSVYGGDKLDPPRYGRVAISVNLEGDALLYESKKNDMIRFLKDRSPLTIEPIFIDPLFMYVDMDVNVYYDKSTTTKSAQQIESIVRQTIADYSSANLDDFSSRLRVSRLSALIDGSDASITSNEISAKPIIEYSPPLNTNENPKFDFGTHIVKPYAYNSSNGFTDYKPSITSSVFSYQDICSTLQDDGRGNIQVINNEVTNRVVVRSSVGTIDYETGQLRLLNFSTDGYTGNAIRIFANTTDNNIQSPSDSILLIRDEDVTVNVIEVQT